jgi:hypothetical protein
MNTLESGYANQLFTEAGSSLDNLVGSGGIKYGQSRDLYQQRLGLSRQEQVAPGVIAQLYKDIRERKSAANDFSKAEDAQISELKQVNENLKTLISKTGGKGSGSGTTVTNNTNVSGTIDITGADALGLQGFVVVGLDQMLTHFSGELKKQGDAESTKLAGVVDNLRNILRAAKNGGG